MFICPVGRQEIPQIAMTRVCCRWSFAMPSCVPVGLMAGTVFWGSYFLSRFVGAVLDAVVSCARVRSRMLAVSCLHAAHIP